VNKAVGSRKKFVCVEWSQGETHCRVTPELGQLLVCVGEECWHNLPGSLLVCKVFHNKGARTALLSATLMLIALFWSLQVELVSDESLLSFIYL